MKSLQKFAAFTKKATSFLLKTLIFLLGALLPTTLWMMYVVIVSYPHIDIDTLGWGLGWAFVFLFMTGIQPAWFVLTLLLVLGLKRYKKLESS